MDINNLQTIIGDKEWLIADLNTQITALQQQSQQHLTLIQNQTGQIGQLNENIKLLTEKILIFTNANITNNFAPGSKRRSVSKSKEAPDFRSKQQKIREFFCGVENTNNNLQNRDENAVSNINNDDNTMDGIDISNNVEIHDRAESSSSQHNLNKRVTNTEPIGSWAEIVETANKSNEKVTPIQIGKVANNNYSDILANVRAKYGGSDFKWVQLNIEAVPRITCEINDIKTGIMEFLRSENIEFNTFGNKETKRRAYILRGLIHGSDNDNI